MNRRNFFRTLFGTLAALPIARLFGWPAPQPVATQGLSWSDMMGEAMEESLTDWEGGYIEVDPFPKASSVTANTWTTINGPENMYIAGVDAAALGKDRMEILVWGSDGRRAISHDSGLTWIELDTTD